MHGRREKRGREAGEKGGNYATLRKTSQSKNAKRREQTNAEREPGLKGTGSGRFNPPPCPSPHMKATEQYFAVVLFIMLYKVVLTFQSE